MYCFQVVKQVLDVLYGHIPGGEREKDELIRQALDQLKISYKAVHERPQVNYGWDSDPFDPFCEDEPLYPFDIESKAVDYSSPVTRFAYVYKYMASHAEMVYQCIYSNNFLSRLFCKDELKVCCIGCGPGSDLLGILKFREVYSINKRLSALLYDGEVSWSEELNVILQKANISLQEPFDVYHLDMGKTNLTQYEKVFSITDLFTVVYFASEAFANKQKASLFFDRLITSMKSGAMILFIDNGEPPDFYAWFDSLIDCRGLEFSRREDAHPFRLSPDEEKTDLGVYYTKYSSGFHEPKLKATIAYRIYRKR